MAAGVGTRLRGAGTASNHRAGSSGDFWRRQRLLRDAPARRLQREGPTRTQFPPAPARMASGTSGPNATWRASTEEDSSMSKNTTQIKAAVVREKGGPFSIASRTLIELWIPTESR